MKTKPPAGLLYRDFLSYLKKTVSAAIDKISFLAQFLSYIPCEASHDSW
jgi:hypothetical protein